MSGNITVVSKLTKHHGSVGRIYQRKLFIADFMFGATPE